MIDPLPPTLPVEPTALWRTAMVVIAGLVAWVAWVFLKTPVRPLARFVDVPEEAPPEGEAKSEGAVEEKTAGEASEAKDEAKSEAKDGESKDEAAKDEAAKDEESKDEESKDA